MPETIIPVSFEDCAVVLPYPSPFILSSVERDWCNTAGNNALRIVRTVYIKRRHLEENLKVVAGRIGMSETEQKKFIDWWCSVKPGTTEVRAEGDPYFDLNYRAGRWMENARGNHNGQVQKSRIEKYAESAQRFYQNVTNQTIPDAAAGQSRFGYADIPDEQ